MQGHTIPVLASFDVSVDHLYGGKRRRAYLGGSLYVHRGKSGEEGCHSRAKMKGSEKVEGNVVVIQIVGRVDAPTFFLPILSLMTLLLMVRKKNGFVVSQCWSVFGGNLRGRGALMKNPRRDITEQDKNLSLLYCTIEKKRTQEMSCMQFPARCHRATSLRLHQFRQDPLGRLNRLTCAHKRFGRY